MSITLDDFIGSTLTQRASTCSCSPSSACSHVILCAIGIYSVLAYSVKRRMREIGLRLAFGASFRDVAGLVIAQGMKPTLIGIGIGLAAALALGRVAASLIYGVSSRDPLSFACSTLVIVLISFVASLIPALRATRVDPLKVLHED